MSWLVYLPLAPLGWLIVEDLRTRTISVLWLSAFAAALWISCWHYAGLETTLRRAGGNLLLLVWLYGGVWLYLRSRRSQGSAPFRGYVGSGDAWFLIALTPAFEIKTYAWFLTLSLAATLLSYLLYRLLWGRRTTIPLVSALGIAYLLYTLILL